MRVRRRSILLSAAFLGLAVFLTGIKPARAQQPKAPLAPPPVAPGNHTQFKESSPPTADQIREALERRMGGGGAKTGGLDPMMLNMLREQLKQDNPKTDPQQLEAILKWLESNPQLMEQLKNEAQKQKSTGQPPDVGKLLKDFPPPKGGLPSAPSPNVGPMTPKGGDPGVVPMPPPLPPKPPDNPNGKTQPPPTRPMGGPPQPAPPPAAPKGETPAVPGSKVGPQPGKAPDPFATLNETPEQIGKRKAAEALAGMWEKNVGPIDETPAVKRALFDLVEGTSDLTDPQGNNFLESLTKDTGDGSSFGDLLDGLEGGSGNWKWPSLDLPSLNWGRSETNLGGGSGGSAPSSGSSWWSRRNSSRSGTSSGGGFGSFGIPALEGSLLPVVILGAILLGALIVWRFWYLKDDRSPEVFELGGLGPWPVDPRRIATREDVVKAFDYLSVLICGASAKMWTHNTIAPALADLARTHLDTAMMLARLYELARYAPLDEPLTTAEIAEARRLVCRLAGISDE